MRIKYITNYASKAVLAALLPFTIMASRATPAPSSMDAGSAQLQQAQLQRVGWEEAKKHKLRHAYWLLEQGDKDYHGHRLEAMREIKKAGEIIGMDLKGDGYGGEKQKWSDEHLREAKVLLKDVALETGGGKEHEHLRIAIKEIDKALDVR